MLTLLSVSVLTAAFSVGPMIFTTSSNIQSSLPVHNIDTGLNYSTIQAAIDASETLDGHTIIVDAGNYAENLDVDKSLEILGAGAEVTAINPDQVDTNTNINASNVIIEGFTIISGSGYYAVYLDKVDNCRISNNIIIGSTGRGIFLSGSNSNTVSGNGIYSLFGNGIDLADSSHRNRILNNHLSLNKYGITVTNGSNYNVISGNFVNSSTWDGVRLNWLGAGLSPVVGNNVTNNILRGNYEGILLDPPSSHNLVSENMISGNDNYGIHLRQATNNTIVYNTVISENYGVYCESSNDNRFYDNFFNNTNNAWDNGVNIWNTTKQPGPNIFGGPYIGGNYWSDNPNPVDVDDDGIGDVPYNITGGINTDYLPLVTEQPIIVMRVRHPTRSDPSPYKGAPGREQYPSDIIISNGTWRREFTNITHAVTQVPLNFTCTYNYRTPTTSGSVPMEFSFSAGEVRSFVFYGINWEDAESRIRPYIYMEEEGANATLTWEYSVANVLNWSLSGETGKMIGLSVAINNFTGPNWGMNAIANKSGVCDKHCQHNDIDYGGSVETKDTCIHQIICFEMKSEISGYVEFVPIPNDLGLLRIWNIQYNDKKFPSPYQTVLWDLDGTLIPQNLVDPEYAVSQGDYLLEIQGLPTGYCAPTLPVKVVAGINWEYRITCLQINALKIAELEPWDFLIGAEYSSFISQSSYSNLVHDVDNEMLTVNVATETLHDWYGCFVLPWNQVVKKLTAHSGNTTYQLSKFYNYTETLVDDYNIVTVRIPPEMDGLELIYTLWNPNADINGDGKVDIKDLVLVIKYYGTAEP